MAFIRKTKKNDKPQINAIKMASKIVFMQLEDASDLELTKLADQLLSGCPLILNHEGLDIDSANKAIAFLSGVCYAISGEILHIRRKIFMFAPKDVYDDGSVKELLNETI